MQAARLKQSGQGIMAPDVSVTTTVPQVMAVPIVPVDLVATNNPSLAADLHQLKVLHHDGSLTEAEYATAKAKVLNATRGG